MGLFHILSRADWLRVRDGDAYAPESLATEGFIHLSYDRQLLASAARHFAGRTDLVVISVRPDRLRAKLRDDPVGDERFPHLYGPLNLDAVVEVVDLPVGPDGRFELPEAWRPWRRFFGA